MISVRVSFIFIILMCKIFCRLCLSIGEKDYYFFFNRIATPKLKIYVGSKNVDHINIDTRQTVRSVTYTDCSASLAYANYINDFLMNELSYKLIKRFRCCQNCH